MKQTIYAKKRVYLDWASSAPVLPEAQRVFIQALGAFGNPSSPHEEGEKAHAILEDARTRIARLAGIKSEGVIFTSGATEANALAIQGVVNASLASVANRSMEISPQKVDKFHVLYLPTAHASVVETMRALETSPERGKPEVSVEPLVIKNGSVDLEKMRDQLRPETLMVSMDVVCGETGTLWNTRDVRRVLDAAHKKGVLKNHVVLHVDASQAAFTELIDCNHLGADLLTLDAQKVGGIRGIGALLRANAYTTKLQPVMYGGGQEQGLRPGTENPALAAAFACALVRAQEGRSTFVARASLLATLTAAIPNIEVNAGKEFSPHILNISFPRRDDRPVIDTDYAVMLLSQAGFAVSTKSACETNEVGSRVVLALASSFGIADKDLNLDSTTAMQARAASTLRISWGPSTPERDLQRFAKELIRTVAFLESNAL